MEKQQDLINRLMKLIKKNPRSIVGVAKDIGINKTVFHNFWRMKKRSEFKTLLIIENYVESQEAI
jgi:hypothetical protein